MKERPIIFSGPMVKAILDGRKTQTRRVIKPQPEGGWAKPPIWVDSLGYYHAGGDPESFLSSKSDLRCPYGVPCDRLWVRETFVLENTSEYHEDELRPTDRPYQEHGDDHYGHYFLIPHYRATEPEPNIVPYNREDTYDDRTSWRPSIFMPRWASRITLEVTEVRVERVQDITEADAIAEGMSCGYVMDHVLPHYEAGEHYVEANYYPEVFRHLWNSINAKRGYSWESNCWVWVVSFKPRDAGQ